MLHVLRGDDGAITSIFKSPQPGTEALDEHDPAIQLFLDAGSKTVPFGDADADFVRVIEDVIDTLIQNNVIMLTDLPVAAQKKLMERKGMRNKMQGALNLFGDDDVIL